MTDKFTIVTVKRINEGQKSTNIIVMVDKTAKTDMRSLHLMYG